MIRLQHTKHTKLQARPDSSLLPPQDLGNAKRFIGTTIWRRSNLLVLQSSRHFLGGLVQFELCLILSEKPWCCIHSSASLDGESLNEVSKSASPKRSKSRMAVHINRFMIHKLLKIVWLIDSYKMGDKNHVKPPQVWMMATWWYPVLPKSYMNWMTKTTMEKYPRKENMFNYTPKNTHTHTLPLKRDLHLNFYSTKNRTISREYHPLNRQLSNLLCQFLPC